jgi:hypothetical protein
MIFVDGRLTRAHIVSYAMNFGEVPKGLCVCHTCDVRECIRADHLWLGTNAQNSADRTAKGRDKPVRGEKNPSSKLTDEQALSIISDPRTQRVIADEYGISISLVCMIKKRQKWAHLTP